MLDEFSLRSKALLSFSCISLGLTLTLNNACAVEPGKHPVPPLAGQSASPVNASPSQGRTTVSPPVTASLQSSSLLRTTTVQGDTAPISSSSVQRPTSLSSANLAGSSLNQSGVGAGNSLRQDRNLSSAIPQSELPSNHSTAVSVPNGDTNIKANVSTRNVSNFQAPQDAISNESHAARTPSQASPINPVQ
jgi:hypothetical protein